MPKNQVSPIEEADPLQLLESNISIDQDVKDHNEINRKDEARDEEDQISNDQHLSQFESEENPSLWLLNGKKGNLMSARWLLMITTIILRPSKTQNQD